CGRDRGRARRLLTDLHGGRVSALVRVNVGAADRELPVRAGDGAGRAAAVAPQDRGGEVRGKARGGGVGERGDGPGEGRSLGGADRDGLGRQRNFRHADRAVSRGGGGAWVLVLDCDSYLVGANVGISMSGGDGEVAVASGDGARAAVAVAPGDGRDEVV